MGLYFPPPNIRAVRPRSRSAAARAGSVISGTGSGLYFSSPFSRVNLIWNRFLLKNAVRSPYGRVDHPRQHLRPDRVEVEFDVFSARIQFPRTAQANRLADQVHLLHLDAVAVDPEDGVGLLEGGLVRRRTP